MRFRLLECKICKRRVWTVDNEYRPTDGDHWHEWWERYTFFAKDNGPGLAPDQTGYFDPQRRCWFVPVSTEMWQAEKGLLPVEPARLELKDGQLWITRLETAA